MQSQRLVATLAVPILTGLLLTACGSDDGSSTSTVTVYTSRHYGVEPVFDAFTKATGIEVRFTTGKDPELRERLIAEGANTEADVLMTSDAANVELAAAAGVLAPISSPALEQAIPPELRATDGTWFALSRRARVPMYSTERVTEPPTSYADLGDPAWKGRLCLRPSTHPYTQSLVASMILDLGEERAAEIVESWVANDPLYIDSDSDILGAIAKGDCDVAITNTYYLGRLLSKDPTLQIAPSWPDQDTTGAHINVSTASVTRHAKHAADARTLIEWLATDGQKAYADANFEFPASPSVAPHEIIAAWGPFRADTAAVLQLGGLNAKAVELLARAKYQ